MRVLVTAELYYLVYWPEEQGVSSVHKASIVSPPLEDIKVGTECQVKEGKSVYSGRIASVGTLVLSLLC